MVSADTCAAMEIPLANCGFISRGSTWRMDIWPTPGARIWSHDPMDPRWNPDYSGFDGVDPYAWPFLGAQDNLR
jgi:hypothetical protein